MPIFEYACRDCGNEFEALMRRQDAPVCPKCGSVQLEKLLSLPVVKSETTKAQALRAAKKRDQAQGTERVQEQLKYERSHND
ncbi:MAG TPA: zinc ribbon domain-containing protein [Gemmatimonadaceae bacterium]